jgi:hypothetical protein
MRCPRCGSDRVGERPERTAQGCRRFRCRACGKQSNERSGTALNRAQYPADVIALVVLWRLRYQLSLRDLPEMFLVRGLVFSHEAVRAWEAKLAPVLTEDSAADAVVASARAGTSMRPTSASAGVGAICTGRSTGTGIWSTCC